MTPPTLNAALPWAAAALLVVATLVFLRASWSRLKTRKLLFLGFVLALAPAVVAVLVWLRLVPEAYVRLIRPMLAPVSAIAMGAVAVRLASEDVSRKSRVRTFLSDLFVTASLLAASAAVMGLEIGRPLDRLSVIVVIDRSRSIDLVPDADARVAAEIASAELGMREDDLIATVAFGANAVTEEPARPKDRHAAAQKALVARDGTDVDAAIRRALAEVPPDSAARIVVMSDGVVTRGDVMGGAAAALAAEVPVDVLPLEQRAVKDVRVVAVRAPARGDAGEPIDLRIVTSSPAATEVELRLLRDGELIKKGNVKIAAGEDVVRVREKLPDAGLHRYDVEVTALDQSLDFSGEDNAGSTFVRVRGEASVLVLEGEPGKGAFIADVLRKASFRVDEATATGVPADLGALAPYDLVVLSDIPASQLAPTQIEALASFVRDFGGGLWLMGGDKSLGPGGFGKTPIEDVSPVSFDLKQEQRRASLAEVIGIDISGSMAAQVNGKTKLELANEAASRAASLLGAGDRLGVEHVDTAVKWSVPLGPVVDKAGIERAIRSVEVGGGGIIVPITLDAAYAALDKEKVNLKHVLLFSDGDDAEDMTPAKPAAAAAKQRGITTSVIALGQGKDVADLEELSRLGGGRFYLIEDAQRLPAVFAQETILAARSAIVEEPFQVSLANGGSAANGVDFGEAPALKGYVVTIPKPRATVHLSGPESDPILASWSIGVGNAGVFTSDLKDRWGVEWTKWPGAARMVAQTARMLGRKAEDERVRLDATAASGQLHVRATVVGDDGRAQSFRRLIARVGGPGGFTREVPLEATGAGAYAASVPLERPGTYVVLARDELSGDPVGTTGAVLSPGDELRPTGTDAALLTKVAEFTGGKRRDSLAGIFADRASRRFAYKDASPVLILAAACALLLAVAARRLGIPDPLVRFYEGLRSPRSHKKTAERAEPAHTVDALLNAKQRGLPVRPAPVATRGEADARSAAGDAPTATPAARPVARAPRIHGSHPIARAGAPRKPPAAGGPTGSGQGPRPMSAAEILLAKRKGKGG